MVNTRSRLSVLGFGLVMLAAFGLLLAQLPRLARSMPEPVYNPPQALRQPYKSSLPPLSKHALLHGEAQTIWRQLSTMDTRFCRWDCGLKGVKYYCRVGKRMALAVVIEDAVRGALTLTAFWASDKYDYDPRNDPGCHQYMNGAHP